MAAKKGGDQGLMQAVKRESLLRVFVGRAKITMLKGMSKILGMGILAGMPFATRFTAASSGEDAPCFASLAARRVFMGVFDGGFWRFETLTQSTGGEQMASLSP